MSLGEQNFGFDAADPVIAGKRNVLLFVIEGLTVADVASAEWKLFDISPVEGTPTEEAGKSTSSGITLADGAGGLEVTVTLDPADTTGLGGDYFHRLDYVATGGGEHEMARGRGRLTPRA